jgi:hypothetical protein
MTAAQPLMQIGMNGPAESAGPFECASIDRAGRARPWCWQPGSGEQSNEIALDLEHRQSHPVTIVVPYAIAGGELSSNAAFATAGADAIFLRRNRCTPHLQGCRS